MNEIHRAKNHALLQTTRTPGWTVVPEVLAKLVEDAKNQALDCEGKDPLGDLHAARGARDLVNNFFKYIASLESRVSETASD